MVLLVQLNLLEGRGKSVSALMILSMSSRNNQGHIFVRGFGGSQVTPIDELDLTVYQASEVAFFKILEILEIGGAAVI